MREIPAVHSTLSPSGLAAMVEEAYGIANPACSLVRRGFNDTYRIQSGGRAWMLRIYLHDKYYISGPGDLRFELDLLDHLHAGGLRVSAAVAMKSGEKLGALRAPEGTRYYALFEPAPGCRVSQPTETQVRRLGESLAALHLAADTFTSPHPRYRLDAAMMIDASLKTLVPRLESRPGDLKTLVDTSSRVRAALASLQVPAPGWGVIHGDVHANNCHFEGDYPTLFDFDTCGFGWRAYDVAVFMAVYALRDEALYHAAFLDAYESVRRLSDGERERLPMFMRARCVWDVGDMCRHADVVGDSAVEKSIEGTLERLRLLDTRLP